ncbi:beta strand repeat-containing protein [Microbacterium mangrovi]|nr:hypothetical protein [Microbacterium mangrovi]
MHLVSRRLVRTLLLPFILVAALCVGLIQPATAEAAAMGTAGLFVPVQGRLVSTLAGTGTTKAPLAANTPRTIQATGAAGLPSTGVAAILVTFTVVDPTVTGQASVGPADGALSGAMRYPAGEATSNSAIVQLSASGQFQIRTTTATNANIDVQGYYTSGSGTAAGGYVPLDFARTVDTLAGVGLPKATLAGSSTSTIQVTGTGGVPTGAAAVFVNFEVQNTDNTTAGNITAYSASATRPTNTLNFGKGKTSLSTIVPLDANGRIKVFVSAGVTINLLMDVEGYFTKGSTASSSGAIFTAKAAKIYDTRTTTPVPSYGSVTIPIGGLNGLPTVAQGLSAITVNVTASNVADATYGSWVRLYPSGEAEPQGVATSFNSGPAGSATTNLVTVEVGADDAIVLHNVSTVAVDYILDLEGWYSSSNPDPTSPEVTGSGGSFRSTTGRLPTVTLAANVPKSVQIAGLVGIPTSGAGAVSLTATVASTSAQGTLNAQATGDPAWSQVSVYGTVPGATSNAAVLAIGGDGTITFQASSAVSLTLDVQGYYTTVQDGTPAPGGFSPVAGSRIVDTRSGLGVPLAKIAPGGSVTIQVGGKGGVPSNAQAVVANFTVINSGGTNGGYVTPYTAGTTRPATSLNYTTGATTAAGAQVSLSPDGRITVANPGATSDSVDLVVDIEGYFAVADGSSGQFTPATGRIYDSRVAPNVTIGPDQTITVPVSGFSDVPSTKHGLSAVVVALTVIDSSSSSGYTRAWASGATEPNPFSSLNYPANSVRTNTITVPVGTDGAIKIHNIGSATVDYVLDLQGWYSSPPKPVISCPDPYSPRSWTKAIPVSPISCTITASGTADSTLTYTVDDGDDVVVSLSGVAPTSVAFSVDAVGGDHVITASYGDGTDLNLSADYTFTLGDWTKDKFVGLPSDAGSAALAPVLAVSPDASGPSFLPEDASRTYSVSASPDMSNPIVVSDALVDSFTVPDGLLTGGKTYYWRALIAGAIDYDGHVASVYTPTWSFTADSAVTESDPTAGLDSVVGTGPSPYMPESDPGNGVQPLYAQYGQCTLYVPYPHLRKSGGYQTVGVKPLTYCPLLLMGTSVSNTTRMYWVRDFGIKSWDVQTGPKFVSYGATTWYDTRRSRYEQTNVVIQCHGTGGTWWIGKTTSNDVERARRYYTSASSIHRWLECGAY